MENQELNIEKILEVTNKYFKGNKEVNLTDLQMELLRNVAEYDDATNNLIKWLNDAIEKDEERSIENYLAEVTNAYEMMLSEKEARKFEQDLKRLNPDVDIKLDKNCTSIDISKSVKELKLPENFYLDENNRITNKENTALSVFVSLKVNEVKKSNKNVEGEKDMTKVEKLNEKEILDGEILNEIPKKKIRKPKFRLFKTIKKGLNFVKNKFIIPDDLVNEEINLDNDFKNLSFIFTIHLVSLILIRVFSIYIFGFESYENNFMIQVLLNIAFIIYEMYMVSKLMSKLKNNITIKKRSSRIKKSPISGRVIDIEQYKNMNK